MKSLSVVFEPFLSVTSDEDLPLLLAILERTAAKHYRSWCESASNAVEKTGLEACAHIEDEIADFIVMIEPDAKNRIAAVHARFPTVEATYMGAFEGLSRAEQFRLQTDGELGGADLQRRFAVGTTGAVSARFASLALGEESNSTFLRVLIG